LVPPRLIEQAELDIPFVEQHRQLWRLDLDDFHLTQHIADRECFQFVVERHQDLWLANIHKS
jgi:hypothetical protein